MCFSELIIALKAAQKTERESLEEGNKGYMKIKRAELQEYVEALN